MIDPEAEADRAEGEIGAYLHQEDMLDQTWIWNLPRGRAESAVLGAAAPASVALVVAAVAQPAWPWWVGLIAGLTVVGPFTVVACAMAIRAGFTGVGWWWSAVATVPAVVWTVTVAVAHAATIPMWGQWVLMPIYAVLSVATGWYWLRWTEATRSIRRGVRWSRERNDV